MESGINMREATQPKLSIILPVYNGEEYIEQTINLLINATYRNIELLLIDDGSKDNSLKICKKYETSDHRVKVYHKENEGVAAARNYGMAHATGDYIAFCDQDDEISSQMYEKMMKRIIKDGSQAAICGTCRKKRNGEKVVFEKFEDDVFEKENIIEKLLLPMLFKGFAEYGNDRINIYTSIWKCVISKELIDKKELKFYGFVNYEDDLIMLIQLFLNAERISTLSDILYDWNTNVKSETFRCRQRYIEDLEQRQQNLMNYIQKQLEMKDIDDIIIRKHRYTLSCRNVLLLLDNFTVSEEKLGAKLKKINRSESVCYIQTTKDIVKPQKGFVRNTIIIFLIRKKHIWTAYFLNTIIDRIRFYVEKYQITEALERKMKR